MSVTLVWEWLVAYKNEVLNEVIRQQISNFYDITLCNVVVELTDVTFSQGQRVKSITLVCGM